MTTPNNSDMTPLISKLSAVLDQETKLVNSGNFDASFALQAEKNELIADFQSRVGQLDKGTKSGLADAFEDLNRLLSANMSALAMARDISTGIIKRVADVVNGPRATNSYGANAKKPTGPLPARRGIAVDKGF
ncbi:MAG: hypothetical protein ACSHYC_05340 [Alphaproteobacteria bacterium]